MNKYSEKDVVEMLNEAEEKMSEISLLTGELNELKYNLVKQLVREERYECFDLNLRKVRRFYR